MSPARKSKLRGYSSNAATIGQPSKPSLKRGYPVSADRILLTTITIERWLDEDNDDLVAVSAQCETGMDKVSIIEAMGMIELAKNILQDDAADEEDDD